MGKIIINVDYLDDFAAAPAKRRHRLHLHRTHIGRVKERHGIVTQVAMRAKIVNGLHAIGQQLIAIE